MLGRAIVVGRLPVVADALMAAASQGQGQKVALANVHMLMEAFDNPVFAAELDQFDWILPDGRPLLWLIRRRFSKAQSGQVRGYDLLHRLCLLAAQQGVKVGIYAGNSTVQTEAIVARLQTLYPALDVVFAQTPPFGQQSKELQAQAAAAIIQSHAQLLFVGIGCPKQEMWIAQQSLPCVQLGVGAAFDFLTGDKRLAPKLWQVLGLEWLWRLLAEPKRLWRRYLILNPRFVVQVLKAWRQPRG